jgi:two-component sensor histidine kinase
VRAEDRHHPGSVDIEQLLDEVEEGRGARDTVVIPVPTQSTSALPDVRSTVREVVERALRPEDAYELQLVCSELVTNAVVHGRPPVRLLLHEGAAEIVVAVFDGGDAPVTVSDSPAAGLRIVEQLTNGRWGARRERAGTWVWAALPRSA